jgi:hypothetical protein
MSCLDMFIFIFFIFKIWLNNKITCNIIPDLWVYTEINDCGHTFMSIFLGVGGDMAGNVYMKSFEVIGVF